MMRDWGLLIPRWGLAAYFIMLACAVLQHPMVFFGRFGRQHRLMGLWHLSLLVIGLSDQFHSAPLFAPFTYDILLGISGTVLTLTAARDFRVAHADIKNVASGALEVTSTITVKEMIEHAFYQGLNLAQIIFLHSIQPSQSLSMRLMLLALVTSPWLLRPWFPVHSFSHNYSKPGAADPRSLIGILYRLKKYQYVFYKHVLLHGLNVSVAISGFGAFLFSFFIF
jgi:hypothetical protein